MYDVDMASSHEGWEEGTVELGTFAGQDVQIRFNTSFEDSMASTTQKSIKAYWSDLFLGSRSRASQKPNIFVILIDTLRPDHLGCYGYQRTTSPNIDKLAAEGIRFENAFSAAPWTNPSILALLTGLYPSDVWEPKPHKEAIRWSLPKKVDTLAEVLAANGYFTIAASDHPGIDYGKFGQGFDIYAHLYHVDGRYLNWRETDGKKVLKQLHTLLEGRPERGLFTYLHLIYPHQPYEPPSPYDDYFGRGTLRIRRVNSASVINMYDGEIKRTDDILGDFLTDIKRLNLDKDSIIIVLSDHGEGFWEHGLWEHGNSLYNELLHIPLIIRAPGRIAEGKTITQLVRNLDLLPTILDLAGIRYDHNNYRGISLLPLMLGEGGENSRRLAFSEFPHSKIIFGRTIQSLTEKLIDPSQDSKPLEYYDLMKDPAERNNLNATESVRISNLLSIMNDISRTASGSRIAHPAEREEPSADTIRKLKSLGYVQ
jgi:arylsulfatase A-like enzyme